MSEISSSPELRSHYSMDLKGLLPGSNLPLHHVHILQMSLHRHSLVRALVLSASSPFLWLQTSSPGPLTWIWLSLPQLVVISIFGPSGPGLYPSVVRVHSGSACLGPWPCLCPVLGSEPSFVPKAHFVFWAPSPWQAQDTYMPYMPSGTIGTSDSPSTDSPKPKPLV